VDVLVDSDGGGWDEGPALAGAAAVGVAAAGFGTVLVILLGGGGGWGSSLFLMLLMSVELADPSANKGTVVGSTLPPRPNSKSTAS